MSSGTAMVWQLDGDLGNVRVLCSDGLFACTRWTNLFFPTRFGLLGDFVGGPLKEVFGPGIRDQAVTARGLVRRNSPVAHTSYWYAEPHTTYAYATRTTDTLWLARTTPSTKEEATRSRGSEGGTGETPLALEALIGALDLDSTGFEASHSAEA